MRRRKRGWIGLAGKLRGGAGAVIFARFDRGKAGGRRRAMPKRPDTLILCLEAAAGRRREPGARPMRRLTDAAKAPLSPAGGRAAADRLRLDQAWTR
ncbi:hypothetical protein AB4Z01_01745, partial [Inquilinus sp. YAF38]|uniref:hypothetical protein n=1 Tax=Inquilinus sp. YAF38 TaxID=3233084 RepID=UPI003F90EB52